MRTHLAVWTLALGLTAPAHAQGNPWTLQDRSQVRFETEGSSIREAASGRFASVAVTLTMDPAHLGAARGTVDVMMASITTDDAAWDAMFRRAPFLDIEEQPRARFTLTGVEGATALVDGHWTLVTLVGELDVHGVTQPRRLPARVRWRRSASGTELLDVRVDFTFEWEAHRIGVPTGWTRTFAGDRARVHVELALERPGPAARPTR